jgi:transcriptional regulator with XRE-family HTH domain
VLASVKESKNARLNRKRLGLAIRKRREALGMSQETLAEASDCHRNYIGTVERGAQNITIDMLTRFADGLKYTVTELARDANL